MIGKIFHPFSNDWKKFSREGNGRIFSHKGHKKGGKKGGRDAGGMPTLKTMKTASRTWKGGRDADGMPERGRLVREVAENRENIAGFP